VMDGDIKKVAQAVMISKKAFRITKENIIGSLAVKLLVMILCAFGVLGNSALFVTALCDAGAFALSLFNSLRALKD
ncbi:MAG: heavy metal translocating P-type ATPase, partial [Oscillospiraceae bacterium]|nr:heavy metal translocating P-type ATPase [Oscillospiraceae bacterium]